MRHSRKIAVTLCCIAGLAACARETPVAPPPPAAPVQQQAESARAYVSLAASLDLLAIKSSELALQRSSSARVRSAASTIIQDHKGLASQLSFAGRRLNLLPSAMLLPRHQAMLASLQSATNFDAAYKAQQLQIHRDALALHSRYARSGASPTLRPVATAAVPVIQRDLRLIGSF